MKIMASSLITSWQIDGKIMETVTDLLFWVPKSLQMLTAATKLKDAFSLEENLDQTRQHIEKQRHYFANKDLPSQSYGFSSSHVWMWELDYKESWALKYWWFWTVVLEKTLESPLDSREIKPFKPKGNPSWIFIGRTEAETPLDVKSWLTGKDPDAGKDWGQKKGATKDEMVGWCHWLNEHEFVQTPGDSEGQRSLKCSSPLSPKETDTT